jgi:HEAT repeats
VTSGQHPQGRDDSVESALTLAASPHWADRAEATQLLANHVADPRATAALMRGLDDPDTAVVAAATEALVRGGGVAGMRAVLGQLAVGDDDAGYHIRDRLVEMWLDGYPVLDAVQAILAQEPLGAARDGASEMLELLHDGPTG